MGRSWDNPAGRGVATPGRPASSEAVEAAHDAGLVYGTDDEPGIHRRRKGRRFEYVGPDGKLVRDRAVLERIRSLAIPPAWQDVWISTRARGHMQATGRDARGRKQHRYHPRWTEQRDATKFDRVAGFGAALPRIRRRVARDLRRADQPKEKVVATIVRLLETTFIRVGNEEYAKHNGSFGLTTLRGRHVNVRGSNVRFLFQGKSGVEVAARVTDRRVASVIKRCEELPGQNLFQYVDADGERRTVTSDDVNEYLREATGADYTAKDFRTWAGTVLALGALRDAAEFAGEAEAEKNVVAAIDSVARRLGHTRAVCRRSYVHPEVIERYTEGGLTIASGVSDEAAALALLRPRVRAKAA